MARPEPLTPGGPASPSGMSPGEQLACEWEARHDVAARGRRLLVAPVQDYLSHSRCEDLRRRAGSRTIGHPHDPGPDSDHHYIDAAVVRDRLRCGEDVLSYFPLARSRARRAH